MTPVMRPPSRAETDAWLEEEGGMLNPQAPQIQEQAGKSEKAGQGSGFAMDANTGKLIPVGADFSQVRRFPCTLDICMEDLLEHNVNLWVSLDCMHAK